MESKFDLPTTVKAPQWDWRWRSQHPAVPSDALPTTIDGSPWLGPVKRQPESSTSMSGAGAVEWLWARYHHHSVELSPWFLFHIERILAGALVPDAGIRLQITEAALLQVGIAESHFEPHPPQEFLTALLPPVIRNAHRFRIREGWWCPTPGEILEALSQGLAVQVALVAYPGWESEWTTKTGVIPLPEPHERPVGGIALLAYGYDLVSQVLWVRNGWGSEWGQQGNGEVPLAYLHSQKTFLSARAYRL